MRVLPRRLSQTRFLEDWRFLLHTGLALLCGGLAGLLVVALPNPLIGFAAIFGLLIGGLMVARPAFTLGVILAVCCLLPYGVIPLKLGLTLTLLEASLLVLDAAWLLGLGLRARQTGEKLVTSPFDWALFLFVGLSLFSLILGLQTVSSSDIIHNYFKLLLAILVFFPVINLVRTQRTVDGLLKILMLAGAIAGYVGTGLYLLNRELQESLLTRLGIVGYPTEGRILRFRDDDPALAQRATGTSVDPNNFGGMLVLIIALLLTQLFSPRPLFRRWLLVLMLIGPGISLYLTYGRGAQLGAIGVMALIATVKYRKIWLYAAPFIVVGWLVLPNTSLGASFAAGFALQDQSTVLRLSEYQNALDIIGRYPWFGIGFGPAPDPDLQAGVSSIYLMIGERMGLVGLAAFILLMALFFIYIVPNFSRLQDERQKANLLGLAGGVVGALAVGVLDHYFFNIEFSHMAALLWLFMALAVAQIKVADFLATDKHRF